MPHVVTREADADDAAAVVLSMTLDRQELADLRSFAQERVQAEYETAQDLAALERNFDAPIRRAVLALRVDAALAAAAGS